MRFISYSRLLSIGSADRVKTQEGRKEVLKELDPKMSQHAEIAEFLTALTDEQLVFLQWIEQHSALKKLLVGEVPTAVFVDKLKWLEHGLFDRFSEFISPFLLPALLQLSPELNLPQRANGFSFAVLLPPEGRSLIDRAYFLPFRSELDRLLVQLDPAKTETELLKLADQLTSSDFLLAVNCLSRSSYNERVNYIDSVLRIVKHNQCTVRLAGRILRKLGLIELNPEHEQKLRELEKTRLKGQLVQDRKRKALFSKIPRETWIGVFFFLLLIASSVYLFLQPKVQKNSTDDLELNSSFEQFSAEERKQIDSLLRLRQKEAVQEAVDQDQYLWTQGNGLSMAIRKPLKNAQMEQLYSDWILNADLHFNQQISACKPYEKSSDFKFPGIGDLLSETGEQTLTIRNECDYKVAFYSFQEKTNGEVNMTLIKRGSQVTVKVRKDDHFLFVAGNDPAPFAPKNATGDLPSPAFTSHFCSADANLAESLSMIYKLALPSAQRNKLMLRGDSTASFFVADLYGILETIW
jgi:hypothetical protein